MKRLLLLFIALPCLAFSQKNLPIGDFHLENNTVMYHHIFIDNAADSAPILAKKLMATLALLPNIRDLVQSGNIITGRYDWINEVTLSTSELKADFSIEIKNVKYLVTIYDFSQTQTEVLSSSGYLVPWDFTYVRDDKTQWRPVASQDLPQYDTQFTNMFAIPINQPESDW